MPAVHKPGKQLGKKVPLAFIRKIADGHGRANVIADLNVTPMVDMLTMLVIFLLLTFSASGEILTITKDIQLPKAFNAVELERAPIIAISKAKIAFEGQFVMDANEISNERYVDFVLPPLRERQEDIPLLAQHFLTKLGANTDVAPQVMAALSGYGWKGNVRELENVMERAVILARGEPVQLYHLPEEFQTLATPASRPMSLEEVEQQHIIKVLRLAKDLDEAATILGIDPATLYRKRKKYGL